MLEPRKDRAHNFLWLSVGLGACVMLSHGVSFIAKVVFRASLDPESYGIFAFFANAFPTFLLVAHLYLEFPIVSKVSENPTDRQMYERTKAELSSTAIMTSGLVGVFFFFWTGATTGYWYLSAFTAMVLMVSAICNVLLAFSRGQDRLGPTGIAWLLGGVARLAFLLCFVWGILFPRTLASACVAFTLPWVFWLIAVVHYEGLPRPAMPSLSFIRPYYRDAFLAFLTGLALQLPPFASILIIMEAYGFVELGDFDIALISYSLFSVIVAGAAYVVLAKARRMPAFTLYAGSLLKKLGPVLVVFSILIITTSSYLEPLGLAVLAKVGLPNTVYWPVVTLLVFAVPVRILLELIVPYFQGHGVFKPVGVIAMATVLGSLPILFIVIVNWSLVGAAIGIGLVNLVMLLALGLFGLSDERRNARATGIKILHDVSDGQMDQPS